MAIPLNIVTSLDRRGRPFWVAAGLMLITGVWTVDVLTGPEVSLSIFYLIPIVLVTWFAGRRFGIATSICSAVAWFLADGLSGQVYSNGWIRYWNAVVRLGFFAVVTFLLPALKALEHEKELARHDYLTGAANRRLFFELLQREIGLSQRYKRPFTIAVIDIDNFKSVNDQCGHVTGDHVLRAVASVAQGRLRQTDVVARLGGDEFAFLLPETHHAAAQIAIAKLQRALMDEMRRNGWPVTFSIGAITCTEKEHTADTLMQRVDGLLYSAKNHGKNAIESDVLSSRT